MLYLVRGKVRTRKYMGKESDAADETRLVEATCESEAVQKFENYFASKTQEYGIYYYTSSIEAFETIL